MPPQPRRRAAKKQIAKKQPAKKAAGKKAVKKAAKKASAAKAPRVLRFEADPRALHGVVDDLGGLIDAPVRTAGFGDLTPADGPDRVAGVPAAAPARPRGARRPRLRPRAAVRRRPHAGADLRDGPARGPVLVPARERARRAGDAGAATAATTAGAGAGRRTARGSSTPSRRTSGSRSASPGCWRRCRGCRCSLVPAGHPSTAADPLRADPPGSVRHRRQRAPQGRRARAHRGRARHRRRRRRDAPRHAASPPRSATCWRAPPPCASRATRSSPRHRSTSAGCARPSAASRPLVPRPVGPIGPRPRSASCRAHRARRDRHRGAAPADHLAEPAGRFRARDGAAGRAERPRPRRAVAQPARRACARQGRQAGHRRARQPAEDRARRLDARPRRAAARHRHVPGVADGVDREALVRQSADPRIATPQPVDVDRLYLSVARRLPGPARRVEHQALRRGGLLVAAGLGPRSADGARPVRARRQAVLLLLPRHQHALVKITERKIKESADPQAQLYQRQFFATATRCAPSTTGGCRSGRSRCGPRSRPNLDLTPNPPGPPIVRAASARTARTCSGRRSATSSSTSRSTASTGTGGTRYFPVPLLAVAAHLGTPADKTDIVNAYTSDPEAWFPASGPVHRLRGEHETRRDRDREHHAAVQRRAGQPR